MMKKQSFGNNGCLRRLGRFLGGVMALIILLAVAGMSYQAIATARDLRAHPPPGELFDVGDHQLHLYCMGNGFPTVILETGLGESSLSWHLVQEEAAQMTRVCAYDRAGLGWSEGVKGPLSSVEIAQDLHILLSAAQIKPPYVLVGHSAGGVHVRSFSRLYPDEVVGLVLVDSSHEQQMLRQNEVADPGNSPQASFASISALLPTLSRLGIMRLLGLGDTAAAETPFPAEIQAAMAATMNRTAHVVASNLESNAFTLDSSQTTPPASLGDLPLIVITRGIGNVEEMADIPIPGLPADYWQKMDALWLAMQDELADLSTHSQHWVAEESGHMIPNDQPALVSKAIRYLSLGSR